MIDDDILSHLVAKVESCKRRYQKAKDDFWAVVGKPTDMPHPDGTQRIHAVIATEKYALNAYIEAIQCRAPFHPPLPARPVGHSQELEIFFGMR